MGQKSSIVYVLQEVKVDYRNHRNGPQEHEKRNLKKGKKEQYKTTFSALVMVKTNNMER